MLKPTWSIQNEISKRVQKEAESEYWNKLETPPLPKYHKCENIKYTAGYVNFIKSVIGELRP